MGEMKVSGKALLDDCINVGVGDGEISCVIVGFISDYVFYIILDVGHEFRGFPGHMDGGVTAAVGEGFGVDGEGSDDCVGVEEEGAGTVYSSFPTGIWGEEVDFEKPLVFADGCDGFDGCGLKGEGFGLGWYRIGALGGEAGEG